MCFILANDIIFNIGLKSTAKSSVAVIFCRFISYPRPCASYMCLVFIVFLQADRCLKSGFCAGSLNSTFGRMVGHHSEIRERCVRLGIIPLTVCTELL